jgi:hypothetical protein
MIVLLAMLKFVLLAVFLAMLLLAVWEVILAVLVNVNFSSCPQSMSGKNCLLPNLQPPFIIFFPTHSIYTIYLAKVLQMNYRSEMWTNWHLLNIQY